MVVLVQLDVILKPLRWFILIFVGKFVPLLNVAGR